MTKSTKRALLIALAVVIVGGLIAWTVTTSRNRQQGAAVEFGDVATATIEERVDASGRIFPVTDVGIASDVSGEVVKLFVREGDSVRAGQRIAQVDADAIESQVARAQAGVNQAQAGVSQARASIQEAEATKRQLEATLANNRLAFKRVSELAAEGLASQQELEAAQVAVETTEANIAAAEARANAARETVRGNEYQVASAQATLREFRTSLRQTNITAPMDGILSQLNVEEGERVVGTMQMAGTELARVADLSQMEVRVEVSESDIPRVALGDAVDIEVDAYLDRTFRGRVEEISSSANNLTTATGTQSLNTDQVTNFVVTIVIAPGSYADLVTPERPYPFRPGMSAAVEILTQIVEGATAVPVASVTARERETEGKRTARAGVGAGADEEFDYDDLEEVVWVLAADNTVERRVVKTGVQNRDLIQITEGLSVGERIVVGPYAQVARKLEDEDEVYEDEGDDRNDADDDDED